MKIQWMPVPPRSHPDRTAATLAQIGRRPGDAGASALPGAGAADCRIDLKLLQWRALRAVAASAASREHLQPFALHAHPDLWAGTVQDGVARGFAARLEEAIALAGLPVVPPLPDIGEPTQAVTGKDLRRRKDLLVSSGGPRLRFSRQTGVLFVDRARGVQSANCLRFEARADHGDLDGFAGAADERPRLFSAQFLRPVEFAEGRAGSRLVLRGRIGRGRIGWDVTATAVGLSAADVVHLRIAVDNRLMGWRLRARWLGIPSAAIAHDCTPVREIVDGGPAKFVAFTLVRAVDLLRVDDHPVPAPAAACLGTLVHDFHLGGERPDAPLDSVGERA
jgi:hypothetical protein